MQDNGNDKPDLGVLRGSPAQCHRPNAIPVHAAANLANNNNNNCPSDVSDSTASSPVEHAPNHRITTAQIELPPRSERSGKNLVCDIELGDMVEVLQVPVRYGVVRWVGMFPESKDPSRIVVGLEMVSVRHEEGGV